jgi:hypothetical protein
MVLNLYEKIESALIDLVSELNEEGNNYVLSSSKRSKKFKISERRLLRNKPIYQVNIQDVYLTKYVLHHSLSEESGFLSEKVGNYLEKILENESRVNVRNLSPK